MHMLRHDGVRPQIERPVLATQIDRLQHPIPRSVTIQKRPSLKTGERYEMGVARDVVSAAPLPVRLRHDSIVPVPSGIRGYLHAHAKSVGHGTQYLLRRLRPWVLLRASHTVILTILVQIGTSRTNLGQRAIWRQTASSPVPCEVTTRVPCSRLREHAFGTTKQGKYRQSQRGHALSATKQGKHTGAMPFKAARVPCTTRSVDMLLEPHGLGHRCRQKGETASPTG